MRRLVVEKNSKLLVVRTVLVGALCLLVSVAIEPRVQAQQSIVGVTICAEASSIAITAPAGDSVVTNPTVALQGTVSQASQIEIRIDGVFDSTIPLSIGQTSFTGSLQLTPGTHTIEAAAVNMCAGPNDTASVVITYSPPPQEASSGSETTTVVGESNSSSTTGGQSQEGQGWFSGGLSAITGPLESTAQWLNIDLGSSIGQDQSPGRMSGGQAIAFTAGVLLAFSNATPAIVYYVASLPAIAHLLPATTTTVRSRSRFLSLGGRLIGIGLILGALFL